MTPVGLVTVRRWILALLDGEYWTITIDGADVTAWCCYADDRRGYVVTYVPNAGGRGVTLDARTGRPVRVFRWGHVVIRRRSVAASELDGLNVDANGAWYAAS